VLPNYFFSSVGAGFVSVGAGFVSVGVGAGFVSVVVGFGFGGVVSWQPAMNGDSTNATSTTSSRYLIRDLLSL
jgi:hypothetical protein